MFILLGIHVITRRRVQSRSSGGGGGGGWQQTRQKYDKSPTPKMYTIGLVSSVTVMYFAS